MGMNKKKKRMGQPKRHHVIQRLPLRRRAALHPRPLSRASVPFHLPARRVDTKLPASQGGEREEEDWKEEFLDSGAGQ